MLPTWAKAAVGAIAAFLAQLQVIFVSDDLTFGDISAAQWVLLVSVAFNAGVAVFAVKNGASPNPDTSTPEPVTPMDALPPPANGEYVRLPNGMLAQVVYEDEPPPPAN